MADNPKRERFIALHTPELINALCADKELTQQEREQFRQFCQHIGAIYHVEYSRLLDVLKTAYAPFDPDSDTRSLVKLSAEHKQQKLNDLFKELSWLLERANFRHLSRDDIEPALAGASAWGMHMDVDFRVFERLAIFARGDTVQMRMGRRGLKRWRLQELPVPIYQRLVMIFKLRPHPRLGKAVDTEKVYFQLFKDIPQLDIKMLLPGARVRISRVDRSKIGLSLLTGLALTAWRILSEVASDLAQIVFSFDHPAALWGLATGTIGYGARTYYGWQQTRQRYNLSLTQILYYQNLDTNAGVLFRLLNEAEEQECREVILAYYSLWRSGTELGATGRDLGDSIQVDLWRRMNLTIDCELRAPLAHLERLKVVDRVDDHYRAKPLAEVLQALERTWEGYIKEATLEPRIFSRLA